MTEKSSVRERMEEYQRRSFNAGTEGKVINFFLISTNTAII